MRYIALLRGINVGGHNKIKMDELREVFEKLGFEDVKSYLATGNLGFNARKTKETTLISKIKKAIESNFSLDIEVMLRSKEEIARVIEQNPFSFDQADSKCFVVFLNKELSDKNAKDLLSHNNKNEKFEVIGRDIYCLSKKGFMGSLLGKKYIDNKLKTPSTARNWNSVNKLLEV